MRFFSSRSERRKLFSRVFPDCFGCRSRRSRFDRDAGEYEYDDIENDMTESLFSDVYVSNGEPDSDDGNARSEMGKLRSSLLSRPQRRSRGRKEKSRKTRAPAQRKHVRFAENPVVLGSGAKSQSSIGSTGSNSSHMDLAEFISFVSTAEPRKKSDGENGPR